MKLKVKQKFKNDKYRKSRGGYSRLLDVTCFWCRKHICFYQKDGPGNLRLMYLDRIYNPKVTISKNNFFCPSKHWLGVKMVYKKENRSAFRMFVDSLKKKIVKS